MGLNIFRVPTGLALTVDCIPLEGESIVVVPISQLSGGMVKGLTARGHGNSPYICIIARATNYGNSPDALVEKWAIHGRTRLGRTFGLERSGTENLG